MEEVTYRGHTIRLAVEKTGGSTYTWHYQIDDGPATVCEHPPLSTELLARDEALMEARWAIDKMPK